MSRMIDSRFIFELIKKSYEPFFEGPPSTLDGIINDELLIFENNDRYRFKMRDKSRKSYYWIDQRKWFERLINNDNVPEKLKLRDPQQKFPLRKLIENYENARNDTFKEECEYCPEHEHCAIFEDEKFSRCNNYKDFINDYDSQLTFESNLFNVLKRLFINYYDRNFRKYKRYVLLLCEELSVDERYVNIIKNSKTYIELNTELIIHARNAKGKQLCSIEKNDEDTSNPYKNKASECDLKLDYQQGKDEPKLAFSFVKYYREPQEALVYMMQNAFLKSNDYAIVGPPGIGKTLLARRFAFQCINDPATPEHLKYQSILCVSFSGSLRLTIENLKHTGTINGSDMFEGKIELLRKLPKPALLILDNVDDIEGVLQEKEVYRDLYRTGCHILFTSRCLDLDGIEGIYTYEMPPLLDEQLLQLFEDVYGPVDAADFPIAEELITQYLKKNTYLTVLAASLSRRKGTNGIRNVYDAFQNLGQVGKEKQVFSVTKDGMPHQENLMEHFRLLYDVDSRTEDQKILLMNLAALPLNGLPRLDKFMELAFPEERLSSMYSAFEQLQSGYWVLVRDDSIPYLHPMVREMLYASVTDETVQCQRHYIQEISHSLETLTQVAYYSGLDRDLKLALGVYELYREKLLKGTISHIVLAELVTNIASAYETIKRYEEAAHYGGVAVMSLRSCDVSDDEVSMYRYAKCANLCGNALCHTKERAPEARSILLEGEAIANEYIGVDTGFDFELLLSKIHGNLGATYYTNEDYKNALFYYEKTRIYREKKHNETGKFAVLLSKAYTNIGSAYYRLAEEEYREENLTLSLKAHKRAIALCESSVGHENLSTVIAAIRLVGTGVELLSTYGNKCEQENMLEEYAMRMERAIQYLQTIEPIFDEIHAVISNSIQIVKLAKKTENSEEIHKAARAVLESGRDFPNEIYYRLEPELRQLDNLLVE